MTARDALQTEDRSLVLRGARGVVRKISEMSDLRELLDDRPDGHRPVFRVVAGSVRDEA